MNISTNDKRRDQRLNLRTTSEEREMINRAALIATGGDITRYVVGVTLEAARHTIDDFETTRLSHVNREAFYELVLIEPPKPNAALRALAANPVPEGFELEES